MTLRKLGYSAQGIDANCDLDALTVAVGNASGAAAAAAALATAVSAENDALDDRVDAVELAVINAQASGTQGIADAADVQTNLDATNVRVTAVEAAVIVAQATADEALELAGGGGGGPVIASDWLLAAAFGVVGDGVTDDTAAMNTALAAAAAQGRVLYCQGLTILITAALTMTNCPGILFDAVSHGSAGGPGIYVTGSGYTALTVNGYIQTFAASIYGTGNTANGVLFQNILLSRVQSCRVFGLNGFGVKMNKCWDNVCQTISVEECGNATHYAFSIEPDGDTTNMTHIVRLQVEKATTKAIRIDGSTLSCVIDNIHCEQFVPTAGVDTVVLGGSRGTFNNARFASAGVPANATIRLAAGNATYVNLFVEGAIDVVCDPGSINSSATIITPEIQGTFHIQNGATGGQAIIIGGLITSTVDPTLATGTTVPSIKAIGTHFLTLSLGFQTGFDPTLATFTDCLIDLLVSTSTHASATFRGCTIVECGDLLGGVNIIVDSTIASATAILAITGEYYFRSSFVNAAITFSNARPIRGTSTTFAGAITRGDAGNTDVMFDDSVRLTTGGHYAGIFLAPTGGAHYIGDYHSNKNKVVGQPKAFSNTTNATPGAWVSEGNL